jgi:hypothetical protein
MPLNYYSATGIKFAGNCGWMCQIFISVACETLKAQVRAVFHLINLILSGRN